MKDAVVRGLLARAGDFLQSAIGMTVSSGKIREPEKNEPVFAMMCDAAGRIVFLCKANGPVYEILRGYAHPYAFPTDKGWDGKSKKEEGAVKLAGSPPFILLFLDERGVTEHWLLNPTGALLWAVRFSGMNGIQPHLESFDVMYRVDMIFFGEH